MSIQFKRSGTTNEVPDIADILPGEIAINLADKKLYTSDNNDIINIGFSIEEAQEVFLSKTGGTVFGLLHYGADELITQGNELVHKSYVDGAINTAIDGVETIILNENRWLSKTNPQPIGNITVTSTPTSSNHVIRLAEIANMVRNNSNQTINGRLTINDGVSAGHAVTKRQLDGVNAAAVLKQGGDQSINGTFGILPPRSNNHATTKFYVDDAIQTAVDNIDTTVDLSGYYTKTQSDARFLTTRNIPASGNSPTIIVGASELFNGFHWTGGNSYRMDDNNNGAHIFRVANSTKLTLTSSGAVVGGSLAVSSDLTCDGIIRANTFRADSGTTITMGVSNGTNNLQGTTKVDDIQLSNTSELKMGTTTPGYFKWGNNYTTVHYGNLNVTSTGTAPGNIIANGDVIANLAGTSDKYIKKDIKQIENALDKVDELQGVLYTHKGNGKRKTGLIAQDVEKVLPEAVGDSYSEEFEKDIKHVYYGEMAGLLVEAIKELRSEIEEIKKKL